MDRLKGPCKKKVTEFNLTSITQYNKTTNTSPTIKLLAFFLYPYKEHKNMNFYLQNNSFSVISQIIPSNIFSLNILIN